MQHSRCPSPRRTQRAPYADQTACSSSPWGRHRRTGPSSMSLPSWAFQVLHLEHVFQLLSLQHPLSTASRRLIPVESFFSWHSRDGRSYILSSSVPTHNVSSGDVVFRLQHHVSRRPCSLEMDPHHQNRGLRTDFLPKFTLLGQGHLICTSSFLSTSNVSQTFFALISSSLLHNLPPSPFTQRELLFKR